MKSTCIKKMHVLQEQVQTKRYTLNANQSGCLRGGGKKDKDAGKGIK